MSPIMSALVRTLAGVFAAVMMVAVLAALAGCGGGGDDEEPAPCYADVIVLPDGQTALAPHNCVPGPALPSPGIPIPGVDCKANPSACK